MDMTMDGSPIIGKLPVKGLYLNGGWCYGGFKATPGSGWCFAHTLAHDEPHALNAPFTLDRFHRGECSMRRARARHRAPTDTGPAGGRPEASQSQYESPRHLAAIKSSHSSCPVMQSIPCPHCGPRAQTEFSYGGDATVRRPHDPEHTSLDVWLDHIYLRDNPRGLHTEWWHQSTAAGAGSRCAGTP